jgi:hypothetical protein
MHLFDNAVGHGNTDAHLDVGLSSYLVHRLARKG